MTNILFSAKVSFNLREGCIKITDVYTKIAVVVILFLPTGEIGLSIRSIDTIGMNRPM